MRQLPRYGPYLFQQLSFLFFLKRLLPPCPLADVIQASKHTHFSHCVFITTKSFIFTKEKYYTLIKDADKSQMAKTQCIISGARESDIKNIWLIWPHQRCTRCPVA